METRQQVSSLLLAIAAGYMGLVSCNPAAAAPVNENMFRGVSYHPPSSLVFVQDKPEAAPQNSEKGPGNTAALQDDHPDEDLMDGFMDKRNKDRPDFKGEKPVPPEDFMHGAPDFPHEKGDHHYYEDKLRARLKDLPPEEREAKIREFEERRDAIKQELMSLPPDQRQARMEELRAQYRKKHAASQEERMKHFQERWDNATDEERARFCKNAAEKCAGGGQPACDIAKSVCGT